MNIWNNSMNQKKKKT